MEPRPSNPPIPFPGSIEALGVQALIEGLPATELGAAYRLLREGWGRDCLLPDDDAFLAGVARLAPEHWNPARLRVLQALDAVAHGCAAGLLLRTARSTLEGMRSRTAAVRTAKSRAGSAGARSRWEGPPGMADDGTCQARAKHVPSPAIGAGATRAPRAPAGGAPSRSDQRISSQRESAAEAGGESPLDPASVAGAIFDGLEAAARLKLDEYRFAQCEAMLRKAVAPWLKEGRIRTRPRPVTLRSGKKELRGGGAARTECEREVRTIAGHPNVRPALMEIGLMRCAILDQDPDQGPIDNPLGYVIKALGALAGGKPLTVYLGDQAIVDKWEALERRVFDAARAMAAATEAARRIDAAAKAQQAAPRAEVRRA